MSKIYNDDSVISLIFVDSRNMLTLWFLHHAEENTEQRGECGN